MTRSQKLSTKIERLEKYRTWLFRERESALRRECSDKTVVLENDQGVPVSRYLIDLMEETYPEMFVSGLSGADRRRMGDHGN